MAASGCAAAVQLAGLGRRRAARRAGARAGARPPRRLSRWAGRAARASPALLSSPGSLAGGPAPAGAGAGRRCLGCPALGRPVVVPGDAGADGPAPRRRTAHLVGPGLSPVPWHLRAEDRDVEEP